MSVSALDGEVQPDREPDDHRKNRNDDWYRHDKFFGNLFDALKATQRILNLGFPRVQNNFRGGRVSY